MSITGEPPCKKSRACKRMPTLKFYDYTTQYDRILVAGERNFYVYSKELSKFSYFKCLFESNFIEKNMKTIHLKDITSKSLELFLIAAQNPEKFKVTRKSLTSLIEISSFFNAPELVIEIISIKANFEKFARVELLKIADEYTLPELKNLVENSFLEGLNDSSGERFYYFGISTEYELEKVTINTVDWLISASDQSFDHFMRKVFNEETEVKRKMIVRILNLVLRSNDHDVCKNFKRLTARMSNDQFSLIKPDVEIFFLMIFNENRALFHKFARVVKENHWDMMEAVKNLMQPGQMPNVASSSHV